MLSVVMSITKLNKITRITFKCQQIVVYNETFEDYTCN